MFICRRKYFNKKYDDKFYGALVEENKKMSERMLIIEMSIFEGVDIFRAVILHMLLPRHMW